MSDFEEVRKRLRAAPRVALFLDYDGTLVPIVPAPEMARPDPALLHLLRRLAASPRVAALAIVSGRSLENLRSDLGLPLEGMSLVGTHGAEMQPAGEPPMALVEREKTARALDPLREAARALAIEAEGFRLDDKGISLALHYRNADAVEGPRRAALFAALVCDPRFETIVGKKVLEVRPKGADKGTATLALLARAPRPPEPLPAFFGDDLTDEDVFRALAGRDDALTVLVAPDLRPTAARYRVPDTGAVRDLLCELV
jgi:trehalose 6-phosphate phosphatase